MKTVTKNGTSNKNKKSMVVYGVTIATGMCLIAVGCSRCYKIGYARGTNAGRNLILDEIVDRTCRNGLTMTNADGVSYVFTAQKLTY